MSPDFFVTYVPGRSGVYSTSRRARCLGSGGRCWCGICCRRFDCWGRAGLHELGPTVLHLLQNSTELSGCVWWRQTRVPLEDQREVPELGILDEVPRRSSAKIDNP